MLEETNTFDEEIPLEPLCVVVVDDSQKALNTLVQHIQNIFPEHLTVVGEAFSVKSSLKVIQASHPDLVFLDIELGAETGFDVLDELPDRNFFVIFVTGFPKYAPEAFRYNAVDFLVKPVNIEHLKESVRRVFALRNRTMVQSNTIVTVPTQQQPPADALVITDTRQNWMVRTTDKTMYALEWNDIIRLEADGKYTFVYRTNGEKLEIAKHLQECLSELPATLFYQTHRSHIINRKHFVSARGYFAFLTNGERADVSVRNWTKFLIDMENGV
jgi:two-component system LytT family response regulator